MRVSSPICLLFILSNSINYKQTQAHKRAQLYEQEHKHEGSRCVFFFIFFNTLLTNTYNKLSVWPPLPPSFPLQLPLQQNNHNHTSWAPGLFFYYHNHHNGPSAHQMSPSTHEKGLSAHGRGPSAPRLEMHLRCVLSLWICGM